MIHTGSQGEFSWLVSGAQIGSLTDVALRFHPGLRLCITSFDRGPLRLAPEEIAQGWTNQGELEISPPG